jgi:hypothetical protein
MDLIAGAIAQSTMWAISSIVIVKATTPVNVEAAGSRHASD